MENKKTPTPEQIRRKEEFMQLLHKINELATAYCEKYPDTKYNTIVAPCQFSYQEIYDMLVEAKGKRIKFVYKSKANPVTEVVFVEE